MAYEYALYEKDGHVATITMNRPERMNAVHPPASEELSQIWDDALADDNVWVVVLTGAGEKAFSAGNDLKYTAEHGFPKKRVKGGFGGLTDRTDIWKPTIAAVNGFALGGGFEMALSCDIIIAAEHARLGLPEPRVGLAAAAGGVRRLAGSAALRVGSGRLRLVFPFRCAFSLPCPCRHSYGQHDQSRQGKIDQSSHRDLLLLCVLWVRELYPQRAPQR